MPIIVSHPAVALAALLLLKGIQKKLSVALTGALLTMLPEMDVIAFRLGILIFILGILMARSLAGSTGSDPYVTHP